MNTIKYIEKFATVFFALCIFFVTSCEHPSGPEEFIRGTGNSGKDDSSYFYFQSGKGTESEPYIIKTLSQLKKFSDTVNKGTSYSGKYIALDADFDLSNENWTPIGCKGKHFSGIFDGRLHKIMKLSVNSSSYQYSGFFGSVHNGTVKNLILENGEISNSYTFSKPSSSDYSCTGALVGYLDDGKVISCGNESVVVRDVDSNSYVGGLVGYASKTEIYNSYNKAGVFGYVSSSTGYAGGISGCVSSTYITNCYNAGSLLSYASGGIIGKNSNYSKISYSYYLGSGGIGILGAGSLDEVACGTFSNGNLNISTSVSSGTLLKCLNTWISAQLNAKKFKQWQLSSGSYPSFSSSDGVSASNSWIYPTSSLTMNWTGNGSKENPFIIKTSQQLADFAYHVNDGTSYEGKYLELGDDITLNPDTMYIKEWTPIGKSSSCSFKGIFDGKNHKINGLYINSNVSCAGLFGYISSGTVKNLILGEGYIYNFDSSGDSGSLAGYLSGTSTVESCRNDGTVIYGKSSSYAGGLLGCINISSSEKAEISYSYNKAAVTTDSGSSGGIAGYVTGGEVEFSNCQNTGKISGKQQGGIIGEYSSSNNSKATIKSCTFTGAEKVCGSGNPTVK